jgi:tRNA pseudouridine65 synthase
MLVHRCEATPAGEVALLQLLRDQLGQHVYPVHRLDQPTSGIVLLGLTSSSAANLVDQFTNRRVEKCYQAVVTGHAPSSGVITIPLSASEGPADTPISKPIQSVPLRQAKTSYVTLAYFQPNWPTEGRDLWRLSLIEATPHTGRWHQIRRHLTSIGHPILGDRRHGDDRYNHTVLERSREYCTDRMMLNASYIRFRHPITEQIVELRCDPDHTYRSIVAQLGDPINQFNVNY